MARKISTSALQVEVCDTCEDTFWLRSCQRKLSQLSDHFNGCGDYITFKSVSNVLYIFFSREADVVFL